MAEISASHKELHFLPHSVYMLLSN